jgi:hopanoid biosynthesis associated RND transporter like protein HpnN
VKDRIDSAVGAALVGWMAFVRKRAAAISWSLLLVSCALGFYALTHLGIDSDNTKIVDEDVPSMIAHTQFSEIFPILDNALIVVIDANTSEQARDAAQVLTDALRARPDRFRSVFEPGGGEFFERNGLLYQGSEDLESFVDGMVAAQPLIAELEREASLANLARLVRMGLDQVRDLEDEVANERWGPVLDRVGEATVAVYSEYPIQVSWQKIFLSGTAIDTDTRSVLMIEPVLDFGSILPAAAPISVIREIAEAEGFVPEQGLSVRITGNPALNYEEMLALAWDIGVAGAFCFLLVAGVVYRALRSVRIAVAALVTLLAGLLWTAAFAAAAVGHINIVSICFAILFIGLGIDFAIHLGMQYAKLRRDGVDHSAALDESARVVGSSLVLCTLTTAIGFYVFVPTDYRGVAELGLIAGTGMFIMLFMTLTLFPALLSCWFQFDPERAAPAELRLRGSWIAWLDRYALGIRWAAFALAVGALWLLPRVEFDPNVVSMRDQSTESVQTFRDLLEDDQLSSPWFANVLEANLPAAVAAAGRIEALDEVGRVVTLQDFIPREQETKRELLVDLAMLLDMPPGEDDRPESSVDEEVAALRALRDYLHEREEALGTPLAFSMSKLRQELTVFLERVDVDPQPDQAIGELSEMLVSGFPAQMERLRRALEPEEVTLENLPTDLVARMIAPDGRARLQIYPAENLNEPLALERFVDAVYTVAERPTGLAVSTVSFGHVTVTSLVDAVTLALLAITLLLYLLWRRFTPVLLIITPLVLGAVLTVAATVLFSIEFNFANVIVIPLLLGMGVDSGIHLVHRAKSNEHSAETLLSTTTARAVFYSAVTTIVSFGSLSFSSHLGMASLGQLLVIGMVLTLVCTLIVLPALLVWRRPQGVGTGSEPASAAAG